MKNKDNKYLILFILLQTANVILGLPILLGTVGVMFGAGLAAIGVLTTGLVTGLTTVIFAEATIWLILIQLGLAVVFANVAIALGLLLYKFGKWYYKFNVELYEKI